MVEYLLDEYLEFSFGTQTPATGAAVDADALPTYRVYEENNDVAVDTGNCAKRDDAGTLGYYCARAQITTVAGYEVGKDYYVEAIAIVGGVTSPPIPIGMFRVVPADVARDDQWTDARADYIDGLDALVIDEVSIGVMANRFDFLYGTPNRDVDNFKYAVCVFTSGGLIGQARTVTGSTAGGGAMFPISLLFATPFTDTPGAGDEFVLWPAASLLVGDEMDIVDAPNATGLVAIAAAVWNYATALCVTAGSIGLMIVDYLGAFVAVVPVADGEDNIREDFDQLPFRRDIEILQGRTWEESYKVRICLHGGDAELIDFTEATTATIRFKASDGTVTAEIALHEAAAAGNVTARLTIAQTTALEAGRQHWEMYFKFPIASTQFPDGEEFSLFSGWAVVHTSIPAV